VVLGEPELGNDAALAERRAIASSIQSFSRSQSGTAFMNERRPRGATER
jgi:hypothetical protein